jgi:hypothetical protein
MEEILLMRRIGQYYQNSNTGICYTLLSDNVVKTLQCDYKRAMFYNDRPMIELLGSILKLNNSIIIEII